VKSPDHPSQVECGHLEGSTFRVGIILMLHSAWLVAEAVLDPVMETPEKQWNVGGIHHFFRPDQEGYECVLLLRMLHHMAVPVGKIINVDDGQ